MNTVLALMTTLFKAWPVLILLSTQLCLTQIGHHVAGMMMKAALWMGQQMVLLGTVFPEVSFYCRSFMICSL